MSSNPQDGANGAANNPNDLGYSTGMSTVYSEESSVFGDSGYYVNMLFDDGVPQFDNSSDSSSMSYEAQRQLIFGSSSSSLTLSVFSETHSSRLSVSSESEHTDPDLERIGAVSVAEFLRLNQPVHPEGFYDFWRARRFFSDDSNSSDSVNEVQFVGYQAPPSEDADDEASSIPSNMSL